MDAEQMRLNRELRMLSSCTGALVRAENELDLLQEICRLIVEVGGYQCAWVGYAERDELCSVRPVATVGIEVEFLSTIGLTWANRPGGRGPIGFAIRERRVHISHDVTIDPVLNKWWSSSHEGGVASIIALPLIVGNECVGALDVYSGRVNSFDVPETALLRALATDLAYGIGALRTRVENQQAQRKLALFRALLDRTNDMIYAVDAETGRLLDANDALAKRLGYTRDELMQMRVPDFSVTARDRPWPESVRLAKMSGFTLDANGQYIDRAGNVHPVELGRSYVEHDEHSYILVVSRDISERKRQQEQIARLTRTLRMQSAINAAILRLADRDELLQEACRVATSLGGYKTASVWMVDPDGKHVRAQYRAGPPRERRLSLVEISDGSTPDNSLGARALRTGQIAVCSDLTRTDSPVAMRESLYAEGVRSVVALPLIVDGVRIGVLTTTSTDESLMCDDELLLLQEITASLSFALRSQQQADTVRYLTHFDPLTGLAKRALFCQRLESLLDAGFGPRDTPTIVAFSVREANRIADRLGGHYVDLLLKELAERLRHHGETDDRIGYLGAGVFVCAEIGAARSGGDLPTFLENTLFSAPFQIEGRSVRATGRYGSARSASDTEDAYSLLQRAEAALRQSRETDTDDLSEPIEVHSTISDRLAHEHMLRRALDARQLELHYLPQLDMATGRIESVEALLRWNEPERGLLLPAQFMPALEASGPIDTVGQWVLQRAIEDGIRWQALGLPPVRIAVNVAPVQVRRRAFVEQCLQALDRWRVRQGYGIDMEVTETAILRNVEGVSAKLKELRAAGVRIALDDFGSRYSSLGLLEKLPLDMIKIDCSVIARLHTDARARALTASIIGLASSLGLTTVAEGVERAEQLAALRTLKCLQWQGYLYTTPLRAEELETLLRAPGAA